MIIVYLKRVYALFRETVKAIVYYSRDFSLSRNIMYTARWWRSLNPGHNSMTDASPWVCFAAIDELNAFLRSDMSIFEYGSGGSTLFFAQRCNEVISIEHHREWYQRVDAHLRKSGINNVKYFLIEPEDDPHFTAKNAGDPGDYISDDADARGKNFERYVKKIDDYEDASFDLVMVDGRSRPSCCAHSIPKVKKGGMLVFDNVETKYYQEAIRLLTPDRWDVRRVYGNVPYIKHFSMTLLARKK